MPDYTKEFMRMNPSLQLKKRDLELLFLLTKYHLLVAEQFSIDTLQPSLNCDLIVNWGGQSNKGGTGYKHSEAEVLRRSFDLRGRYFSELTRNLHRKNRLGTKEETRARLSFRTPKGWLFVRLSSEQVRLFLSRLSQKLLLSLSVLCVPFLVDVKMVNHTLSKGPFIHFAILPIVIESVSLPKSGLLGYLLSYKIPPPLLFVCKESNVAE